MKTNTKTSFILGEEWLYYKIYTGFATTDAILYNQLYPIITGLLRDGLIDKWFFIRYTDPEHHLRLRLHLIKPEHIGTVILAFQHVFRRLTDQHSVWKIQTDTYERELDRYGHELIEQAETLFFYDSECIVNLLSVLETTDDENEKWITGMAAIDTFLDVFRYDFEAKRALMEQLRTSFFKEFKVGTGTKKELSTKYRNHKNEIERFMKLTSQTNDLKAILDKRNSNITEQADNIREQLSDPVTINTLLGSYIHMTMNRLFDSNNRQCEMILYDLLCSYYTSVLARQKKEQQVLSE
ncbi:thiopeptide-type bacteriocin biosynthesis protein [Flavobacterium cerinum]|uniref:Thiopeptide-type bacteriocin biosynthesis protein n=1 Tax=Flavobacterium cerinum TaxID=2502784 RepID=A0ABY5IWS5_9FLAO|nr:thiopeptide-type bacteriocin biosynthesis protein [Flavobacterium cerinum]UUC47260.1 thiopeptide-type bacteriocin biosynthesis protein [Flavobacterium cerinum]